MLSLEQHGGRSFSGESQTKSNVRWEQISKVLRCFGSRQFRVWAILVLVAIIFIAMYASNRNLTDFMVVGGTLGSISSVSTE